MEIKNSENTTTYDELGPVLVTGHLPSSDLSEKSASAPSSVGGAPRRLDARCVAEGRGLFMDKELVKEHVEGHQGRQLRTRTVRIHETGGANRHGSRKQVARAATLSLPPDGSFDDHDVCWERAKFLRESDAYKYAWIPQARLEDFREGLRKKTVDCSYFLQQSGPRAD